MAYKDVAMTRKRMKDELLMGATPKIGVRRAGSTNEEEEEMPTGIGAQAAQGLSKVAAAFIKDDLKKKKLRDAQFEAADWRM
tara:strand:- start:4140 stop:4385 length:246 start_codon:yes stop_codon:yes gene_type:complete